MNDIWEALSLALNMVLELDQDLVAIIGLSLQVTGVAVLMACVIGLPLGAALAIMRFRGIGILRVIVDAMMGLPPVVVGLFVYLMLSRSGPLGTLGLLYTPQAMIIAQTILITPIIAALSRQTIASMHAEYDELLRGMGLGKLATIRTLVWDARFALVTAALAGTGRALAEVGAVMMVGGNIDHATRVMTTAIALETSRGDLALALALGVILMVLSLLLNAVVSWLRNQMSEVGNG